MLLIGEQCHICPVVQNLHCNSPLDPKSQNWEYELAKPVTIGIFTHFPLLYLNIKLS